MSADVEDIMFSPMYSRATDNEEVRKCTHKIADLVSDMTVMLLQNGEKGDIRVKNELSRKIDITPSKNMSRKQFFYNIVRDMINFGNSVVYPVVKDGYIDELQIWDMNAVTYADLQDGGYAVRYKGRQYASDDVLHFVLVPQQFKPFIGEGYINLIKNAVDNLGQADKTKEAFLRSKWKPSVIIAVNSDAEELATSGGRENILNSYISDTDEGKPWVIPADEIKVESIKPLTLMDLGIHESVKLEKQVIASAMGVPAFFVGVGQFGKDEYNNFISTTIYSFAQIIQQELTRKLLYSPYLYFKFNPRSLMMYDLQEKTAHVKELVNSGMLNRNEGRAAFDYSPVDAEGMDDYVVLENYIPVAKIGDQAKLKKYDSAKE